MKNKMVYKTFSDKDFKEHEKASDELLKDVLSSKEKARAWLVKLGTHHTDGSLTKNYGGDD